MKYGAEYNNCKNLARYKSKTKRSNYLANQQIRKFSTCIVQDAAINSGRPIIEGTRVFVDLIIGHLESGMSIAEICYEYDLTPEQVKAVKQLSPEQIQYIKGYADALENAVK